MTDGQSGAGPDGAITRLRRSLTVQSLLILLATRLLLFGASWFTLGIMPRLPYYPAQLPDTFLPETRWLDGWARWDTAHYVTIALHGYGGDGNLSHDGGLGFFPLFPLLMRGLLALGGIEPTESSLAVAAIFVACGCITVAVPVFAHLVDRRFGPGVARTAVVLLCVSPFSYFFSAGYSESLFLMLVVLTFAFVDRRWWMAAAIIVALATSARLAGLALPPALLLLAWRRQASIRDLIGITLISPLGVATFVGYTWWRFDDPLAYFHAQQHWGGWREHVGDYITLFTQHPREALLGDPRHQIIVLNVALLVLWLASLPWVWRLLDPGIALFTTLITVAHGAMTWVSLGRYLLPAIGFYIVVAILLTRPGWREWPRDIVIVSSTMLLTMLTILFAHGFWTI
jgi:hypothetical protein